MDDYRRRPSPATLAWVERSVGRGARVRAWRRMTGGGKVTSVHRLGLDVGNDESLHLVLRQWMPNPADGPDEALRLTRNEAHALSQLASTGIRSPELVAATDGDEADGLPSVLMTRAPGSLDLAPRDPAGWVRQLAAQLVAVHESDLDGPTWERWIDPATLDVLPGTSRPDLWRAAIDVVQHELPDPATCFIHRDYQHFNVLWRSGRLSAVVDWVGAATGPPGIDVGHCRLNLALLFSPETAEAFLRIYEAEAGRTVDPFWDVHSLVGYSSGGMGEGVAHQVGTRATLDVAGMDERVETVLAAALARL